MTDPRANLAALEAARRAVVEHPMCGRLDDDGYKFTIIYPDGDFAVDGVRVVRSAAGLRQALERMERHWVESYPGYRRGWHDD